MTQYSIETRTKKCVKRYGFYHLYQIYLTNIKKQLLVTGLDSLKTAFKKVRHKTIKVLENKISNAVTTWYKNQIAKTKSVEKIIIPPEKREKNIKRIKTSIIKMEHYKISKLLNDSNVTKFATKNYIEVKNLSSG